MQVIQAHRGRVALLAETFRRLLEMEGDLYDLRSKSWGLQEAGTQSREADLENVHETIENLILEVDNLRQVLASPAPAAEGPGQSL